MTCYSPISVSKRSINSKLLFNYIHSIFKLNLELDQVIQYEHLCQTVDQVLTHRPDTSGHSGHNGDSQPFVDNYIATEDHWPHFQVNDNSHESDSYFQISPKINVKRRTTPKRLQFKNSRLKQKMAIEVRDSEDRSGTNLSDVDIGVFDTVNSCDFIDCGQVFTTRKQLERHKQSVHLEIKTFACDQPNCHYRGTTRKLLKSHKISHTNTKQFVCEVDGCAKLFKRRLTLHIHKKYVHGQGADKLLCQWPGCGFSTVYVRGLREHTERLHSDDVSVNDTEIIRHRSNVQSKTILHDLPVNNKRQTTSTSCQSNKSNKSKIATQVGPTNDSDDQSNQLSNHSLIFSCDFVDCGQIFDTQRQLTKHKKIVHFKAKTFACDQPNCDYRGTTRKLLKSHKISHTTTKRFVCQLDGCAKLFKTRLTLHIHMKYVHGQGARELLCQWPGCHFSTVYPRSLREHRDLHLDNEFKCQVCGKCFKNLVGLRKHSLCHTFGEQQCEWPQCQFRGPLGNQFARHMRTHYTNKSYTSHC